MSGDGISRIEMNEEQMELQSTLLWMLPGSVVAHAQCPIRSGDPKTLVGLISWGFVREPDQQGFWAGIRV